MSKKTSLVRRGIFSATGVVTTAIVAAAIAALVLLPLPTLSGAAPVFELTPAAAQQQRVCPGPVVQTTSSVSDASTFLSASESQVVAYPDSSSVVTTNLNPIDNAAPAFLGVPSVLTLADGVDSATTSIAGIQAQSVASDQVYGLATAACAEPSNNTWLVGGATDVGRTTVIMLANPSAVTATVSLEVFAERGRVETPTTGATASIVVEPGEQRMVSLAGYAPDVYAPAVHVVSTGGQVLATMEQTVMRTLVPSGVEFINPSAEPNKAQYITGVHLTGQAEHDDGEMGAVLSDLESTVRVLNTEVEPANVKVQFISESGKIQEVSTVVSAETTTQFPFATIADGTYTVVVTADRAIVAGVRTVQDMTTNFTDSANTSPSTPSTANPKPAKTATPTPSPTKLTTSTPQPSASTVTPTGPSDAGGGFNAQPGMTNGSGSSTSNINSTEFGGDFTWYSSSRTLMNSTILLVPTVQAATVSFYNPTPDALTVELTSTAGGVTSIKVPAGALVTTPLEPQMSYTAVGTAGLFGSMAFGGLGLGSSVALNPDNGFGSAVRVYPR